MKHFVRNVNETIQQENLLEIHLINNLNGDNFYIRDYITSLTMVYFCSVPY